MFGIHHGCQSLQGGNQLMSFPDFERTKTLDEVVLQRLGCCFQQVVALGCEVDVDASLVTRTARTLNQSMVFQPVQDVSDRGLAQAHRVRNFCRYGPLLLRNSSHNNELGSCQPGLFAQFP